MKKLFTLFTVLPVLLAFMLAGCSVEDPASSTDLVAPAGEQLFSNYVAIGNSLTAGYMDSGLLINGQLTSYPKLIAGQIGALEFDQPYVSFPGVGTSSAPAGQAAGVIHWNGSAPTVVGYTDLSTVLDPASGFLMALALPTPYHNLGVPGATLHDVFNAVDATTSTPAGNSFFDFINRPSFFDNVSVSAVPDVSPAYQTASMFGACIAKGPRLLTCWIGNNDILGSATAGTDQLITPVPQFQAEYTGLIQSLAGGLVQRTGFPATIILANIPGISSAPHFIPRAFLEAAPPNGLGINWPWGYEEADTEILTLTGFSWVQDSANQGGPIPGAYTLSAGEVTNIDAAVAQYNGIIAGVADAVNALGVPCGVMDANALLAAQPVPAKTHFMFLVAGGMSVQDAAATSMFSLDGIHPNNHGYGVVANAFIDKINDLSGSSVPHVDTSALIYDPTYGQAPLPGLSTGLGRIDPAVAEAMGAIFRQ